MSAPTLKGVNQEADSNAILGFFTSIMGNLAKLVELTQLNESGIPPAKKRIKIYKKLILKVDLLRSQLRTQWTRLYQDVEFPTIPGYDEEFKKMLSDMASVYEPQLHYVDSGTSDQRETEDETNPMVGENLANFQSTSSFRPRDVVPTVGFTSHGASLVPPAYSSANSSSTSSVSQARSFNDKFVKHVPSFNGDVLHFPLFYQLYMEFVGDIAASDSLKLHLLRSKLTGQALEIVAGFPPDQYDRVMDVLRECYIDPTNVRSHIHALMARVPKLHSRGDIRTFQSILSTLRSVETLVSSFKLDDSFQNELCLHFYNLFQRYVTDAYMRSALTGEHKLKVLLEYLEKEFKLSQRVDQSSSRMVRESESKQKVNKKPLQKRMVNQVGKVVKPKASSSPVTPSAPRASPNSGKEPPCRTCGSRFHNDVFCVWKSTVSKFHLAMEWLLCLICLSDEHKTEQCTRDSNYTCFRCRGRHNRSICPNLVSQRPNVKNRVNQVFRDVESSDSDNDTGVLNGFFKNACKEKEKEQEFAMMVRPARPVNRRSLNIWFGVGQSRIIGMIDTGATINLMPFRIAIQLDPRIRVEPVTDNVNLQAVGDGFTVREYIEIPVTIGLYTRMTRFYVTNRIDQVLLGVDNLFFFHLSISHTLAIRQSSEDNETSHAIERAIVDDDSHVHTVYQVRQQPNVVQASRVSSVLPSVSSMFMIVFLFMFCLFASCSGQAQVETADPLLWFRTTNRAVVGLNATSHIAVLTSPCTQLTQVMKGIESPTELEAFQQCEKAYEREVLRVIRSSCGFVEEIPIMDRQPVEVHVFRRKRFVGIVAGAVTGIVSYGILSLSHIWEKKSESPDVKAVQKELQTQLDKIREHNSLVESYQTKVDNNLKSIWHQMILIDKRVSASDRENKALMLLLQQISKMGLLLTRVLHSFKLEPPKVDIDYQALFPGNPLEDEVSSIHWVPKRCFYTN